LAPVPISPPAPAVCVLRRSLSVSVSGIIYPTLYSRQVTVSVSVIASLNTCTHLPHVPVAGMATACQMCSRPQRPDRFYCYTGWSPFQEPTFARSLNSAASTELDWAPSCDLHSSCTALGALVMKRYVPCFIVSDLAHWPDLPVTPGVNGNRHVAVSVNALTERTSACASLDSCILLQAGCYAGDERQQAPAPRRSRLHRPGHAADKTSLEGAGGPWMIRRVLNRCTLRILVQCSTCSRILPLILLEFCSAVCRIPGAVLS
jgi:hypothetical protein